MKKYRPKVIRCPKCLQHVGKYDGRSTLDYVCRCKTCKKQIIYHIETKKVEIKPLPQRNCSSGVTFC